MRKIYKIKFNSEFWKNIKESAKSAEKLPDWAKSPKTPDPPQIFDIDKLTFKHSLFQLKLKKLIDRRQKLYDKAKEIQSKVIDITKIFQDKCLHQMCLEKRTSYKDEYDDWHDDHFERKCIECLLTEKSSYLINDIYYKSSDTKYDKLEKSQVVQLRKIIDNEEYEVEFEDLKYE